MLLTISTLSNLEDIFLHLLAKNIQNKNNNDNDHAYDNEIKGFSVLLRATSYELTRDIFLVPACLG